MTANNPKRQKAGFKKGRGEVTPKMIRAGVAALESGRGAYADEQMVVEVYRAMRSALPLGKPVVTPP